jgi:hypothetical protein
MEKAKLDFINNLNKIESYTKIMASNAADNSELHKREDALI